MSTIKKIVLVTLLLVFVSVSVWLSFNTVSRPTFEYEEQTNVRGMGLDGTVFSGYNGNASVADVRVYHPMIKNPDRSGENTDAYIEDTSKTVIGIDKFTFVSDENMKICRIGPDVAFIDEQAFFGCFALEAIIVDPANEYYTDEDGILFTKDMSRMILYPAHHVEYLESVDKKTATNDSEETYAVPEGVKAVSTGCFYKVHTITQVTFPKSLEEIGDMAFFKCENLRLVSLPDGIKRIGNDAFSYCTAMKYAMFIPSSMEEIGHHCFYKCDSLQKFFMGAADEDALILGGRWQPKEENKFKAEAAVYGAVRQDADSFNTQKISEEKGE